MKVMETDNCERYRLFTCCLRAQVQLGEHCFLKEVCRYTVISKPTVAFAFKFVDFPQGKRDKTAKNHQASHCYECDAKRSCLVFNKS